MSTGAIVAATSRRAERRLIERLRLAGATSSSKACEIPKLRRIESRRLGRLIARGAIGEPSPGRYYLDEARYEAYRGQRRQLVLMVITGLVGVMIALVWYAKFR